LSIKNIPLLIISSSLFLIGSFISVATAQTDVDKGAAQGWEVEATEPAQDSNSLDSVPQAAADIELKTVGQTELKTVPETQLKAVEKTQLKAVEQTELKAVPETELKTISEPKVARNRENELIVIENTTGQAARPTLNIDPQLRADLDAQYKRVEKNRETADAFSESLGEDYLSYGLLLKQAGRLDEARDVLIDAAHISKINNGLNAPEQRPYLAALFDIHMLQDNTEAANKTIQRIIWLESENPKVRDDLTYPLALRMGNRYLDQFLYKPVAGKDSLESLSQADLYFNYVLRQYGSIPITEIKLPYGELALVNFWRSKVADAASAPANLPTFSGRGTRLGQFPTTRNTTFANVVAPSGGVFFSRAEFYLKRYLARARSEGTPQMVAKAMLNLGDINLMFERRLIASEYYKRAWAEALKLAPGDPFLKTFDQPVALPDFEYALGRKHVVRGNQALLVPMKFKVDQFGRVGDVQPIEKGNKNFPYFSKAKKAVRKTVYRPIIRDGKLVATGLVSDDVLVQIKDIVENPDVVSPDVIAPESSNEVPLETSANEIDEAATTVQEPST